MADQMNVPKIELLKEKNYQGCISLELFNPDLWKQDPLEALKLGLERVKEVVSL